MALEYTNIFDAITEDAAEASELQTRSDLMIAIRDILNAKGWDQKQAAAAMGITQPRVSDLVNGRIEKFSIDKLMTCLYKVGFRFKPVFKDGELSMSVQKVGELNDFLKGNLEKPLSKETKAWVSSPAVGKEQI